MKSLAKLLAPAGLALAAVSTAAPVVAQTQSGVATANVSRAIINTTALQTAYNQISTTYSAQIETRRTKQQELNTLLQPFDTNADGNYDEAEAAAIENSPNFLRIQTLQSEISTITSQINTARLYAIDQLLRQYSISLQEVVAANSITIVLQPEVIQYFAESADITQAITTSINAALPTVGTVPAADYRPTQQSAQVLQDIQQLLLLQALQQQQAAQQQQQQQGATQQPQGR